MAVNLASKYAKKVDEKFVREAQSGLVTNNDYEFTGVKTVQVYSIPTVPLGNYTRSGSTRYGSPSELENNLQELTITQDKAWTFTIDKGNKVQSQMVMDAGRAVSRQLSQVVIPTIDTFIFNEIAAAAPSGHVATTVPTKANAYELFLNAQEALGNANVPDAGRVCLCSYKFANFLKMDPAFMRDAEKAQDMLIKGVIGTVDGVRIVKVPSGHLPTGCSFILTHPMATVAPRQLSEYRIHTDPPGISGWLCEGRILYDCFVLNNKKDAIFYLGTSQPTSAHAASSSGGGSGSGTGGSGTGTGGSGTGTGGTGTGG